MRPDRSCKTCVQMKKWENSNLFVVNPFRTCSEAILPCACELQFHFRNYFGSMSVDNSSELFIAWFFPTFWVRMITHLILVNSFRKDFPTGSAVFCLLDSQQWLGLRFYSGTISSLSCFAFELFVSSSKIWSSAVMRFNRAVLCDTKKCLLRA